MNEQLDDEITSINAIYTPETLVVLSRNPTICSLLIPTHSISLRLELPPTYPDAPPSLLGTQSVGDDIPKGLGSQVVERARLILSHVFTPGVSCIYDLVEDLSAALPRLLADAEGPLEAETGASSDPASSTREADSIQDTPLLSTPPSWIVSAPVTEKKSVFLARAARVHSPEQAAAFIQHLIVTDKKAARASHNITAWRIRGPAGEDGVVYQDSDDDGETAAGGRVLRLLQLMGAWDVVVVVTRWYGGVQLGPDRFRIINQVAREAVVEGGFADKVEEGKASSKKGKK